MKSKISLIFISVAMLSLLAGVIFGVVGAMQFVYPGFLKEFGFFKIRPLHVSLVVSWIFFASVGGIYYYLPRHTGIEWKWKKGPLVHLVLYIATGISIIGCYIAGKFGGREYWEFPPLLAIPIIISWLVFGLNYFQSVFSKKGRWPVYLWMWATGVFFFLFTFLESYLWIFPYFRDNIVKDMAIQWKAYGALTGSWNMLVYGTAIFVMERISGDEKLAYSRISFLMYFLGLANLMFGWSHHIYTLPVAQWVRYLGYAVSMTELIILAKIIWQWRSALISAKKGMDFLPSRFMIAADIWIFLNLLVAILISVPAINLYTHGTHVTVAHAMGSTIGINTMILLSSCLYILWDLNGKKSISQVWSVRGFWLIQICLFIFWIALMAAGIQKGILTIRDKLSFQQIMESVSVYLKVFAFAGVGIFAGLTIVLVPILQGFAAEIMKNKKALMSVVSQQSESQNSNEPIKKIA